MLEDWLREQVGHRVHLWWMNGLQAEVTVEEVGADGTWIRYSQADKRQGVMTTQGVIIAEQAASPEAHRIAVPVPVPPGFPVPPRR
jgi:hypothetical protein